MLIWLGIGAPQRIASHRAELARAHRAHRLGVHRRTAALEADGRRAAARPSSVIELAALLDACRQRLLDEQRALVARVERARTTGACAAAVVATRIDLRLEREQLRRLAHHVDAPVVELGLQPCVGDRRAVGDADHLPLRLLDQMRHQLAARGRPSPRLRGAPTCGPRLGARYSETRADRRERARPGPPGAGHRRDRQQPRRLGPPGGAVDRGGRRGGRRRGQVPDPHRRGGDAPVDARRRRTSTSRAGTSPSAWSSRRTTTCA